MCRKMRRVLELVSSGKIWGFVNWGFDSFELCKKFTFIGELQVAWPCSKVARPCLSLKLLDCGTFSSGTTMLDFGMAVPDCMP